MNQAFQVCNTNGFVCRICLRFANAQLRPCIREHGMCCNCYQRIQKCPICRAARLRIHPEYIREGIHSESNSPCPDVCPNTVRGKMRLDHRREDELSLGDIVIDFSRSCFWHAPTNEIIQHLMEHYQESFITGYNLTIPQEDARPTPDNPIIVQVFIVGQEFFMASWFCHNDGIVFTTIPIVRTNSRCDGYDINLTVEFDDERNEDNRIETVYFTQSSYQIQGLLVKGCVRDYGVEILWFRFPYVNDQVQLD